MQLLTPYFKRIAGPLSVCLLVLLVAGCSSSEYANIAGKYSRTPHYPATKFSHAYSYTNTTELRADGTYTMTTDREGALKVLDTGTFEVKGESITYRSDSIDFAGNRTYGKIKNGVLDPGLFERRKRDVSRQDTHNSTTNR